MYSTNNLITSPFVLAAMGDEVDREFDRACERERTMTSAQIDKFKPKSRRAKNRFNEHKTHKWHVDKLSPFRGKNAMLVRCNCSWLGWFVLGDDVVRSEL